MEVQKTNQASLEAAIKKLLLEDENILKKVVKEILLEDKDIIKDVIREIMNGKSSETEEERRKRLDKIIDKHFDEYDAVFKALA